MRAWENSEQHRRCVCESLGVRRLCPVIPRFSTWFGADMVVLWNRSRWVSWFWTVTVTCSHEPPFAPWWLTFLVGSANLATSGLRPSLSGQMNLNDGKGLFFASVLIADTLTGKKHRHLGSYGRVWIDSHLILACPLSASFTLGLSGFRCTLREMMFLAWGCHKSKGSPSVQAWLPPALFSHCQPAIMCGLNDTATARTAAATVQELSWSALQNTEKTLIIWESIPAYA